MFSKKKLKINFFLIFFGLFDVLILKIIFKKIKKYHFNVFRYKKTL
jgi:hypothetical protein